MFIDTYIPGKNIEQNETKKPQENDLKNKPKSVFGVVFGEELRPSGDRQVLKNKIQLNIFIDLIGFIQWFMNWATFHLTNRKELQEAV